jgi:hypothetical protein
MTLPSIPFGWWLMQENYTIIQTGKPNRESVVRRAKLYPGVVTLETGLDGDSPIKLIGFTDNPAVVIAWINDGIKP